MSLKKDSTMDVVTWKIERSHGTLFKEDLTIDVLLGIPMLSKIPNVLKKDVNVPLDH